MTAQTTEAKGGKDFVKQSNLYQEFLAEREEILKHKWLESERLGYDIGFERALLDWIRKHRDTWRASRRAQLGVSAPFTNTPGVSERTSSPATSPAQPDQK